MVTEQDVIIVLKAIRMASPYPRTRGAALFRRVSWILDPAKTHAPWEVRTRPPTPNPPFERAWPELVRYAKRYLARWDPALKVKHEQYVKLQNITTARGATASEAQTAARMAQRLATEWGFSN